MVFVLGASNRNPLLASRTYAMEYPYRRAPDIKTFENLLTRFLRTGSVNYVKHERTKSMVTEDNEVTVVQSVVENPRVSTRIISKEHGIEVTAVRRILKKHKFHPYKIQNHQGLLQTDFERRLVYCEWLLFQLRQDLTFLDHVLFTDEATFANCGITNRKNSHYYDTRNPHFVQPILYQQKWSVNTWGGIIGNTIVGPFFFNNTLNCEIYTNFLQNNLPLLLEDLPDNVIRRLWYQHDGAPAHYGAAARTHLDRVFTNRWIGRGSFISWPPRSPDLTPCDFFLWPTVKNIVYETPPTTAENMQQRIRNAFLQLSENNMAQNVSLSMQRRLRACVEQNGNIFEHILN